MLVIKVGLFLLLVMGCDDEDTAPKNESSQTETCLDLADEVVEMMTECETSDQSLQSCTSKIGDKGDALNNCFTELAEECENKESDDLKRACEKQLRDDFGPIEIEIKKIRTKIRLKDCDKEESEELKKTCREELEERLRNIERIEQLETRKTEVCLDLADEVVEMTSECETTDQSLQSCKSTINAKLKDMSECFFYLTMKCAEEATDDLKETCNKQIRDDFAPVEIEIRKIKARIGSKDQPDDESEEL